MDSADLINKINLNDLIPLRDTNAISGSEFIKNNWNNSVKEREQNILQEFLNGNIPNFLRGFTEITVTNNNDKLTYLVMNDYLSIGSDDDYIRMPMNPLTAQQIADKYDCTLPTEKMVNDIWKQSINKLTPLPWGPPYDSSMYSSYRFKEHNDKINKQLINKDSTKLTSGHKKDIVLTNRLYPNNPKKRVAIYGWIYPNGKPIQQLNPVTHEHTFLDYSHGVRLISNYTIVNNQLIRIQDIFADNKLCSLLSIEGELKFTRY